MAMLAARSAVPARIVHHIPGRLRLRLEPGINSPDALAQLCEAACALPGVAAAIPKPATGSILVRYDPQMLPPERVAERLQLAPARRLASPLNDAPRRQERLADIVTGKLVELTIETLARAALAAAL